MKTSVKSTIIALCLGTAMTASAQLKLNSNGNLSFKLTSDGSPIAPITLGGAGEDDSDSNYFMAYRGGRNGIFASAQGTPFPDSSGRSFGGYFSCYTTSAETLVGLRGYSGFSLATSSDNNPGSVGVWGSCFPFGIDRYGYGVLGQATGNFYSAGVCGVSSTASVSNAVPDDNYAGLFVGKTKVVGTLTATGGLYNTTLHNCPTGSGRSETMTIANDGMTTRLLQGLNAFAYHNMKKTGDGRPRPTFFDPDPATVKELEKLGVDVSKLNVEDEDVIDRQIQEKQHYALSADELEEVLPDLVYTGKDGAKAINYVEMVPLLVQCINELGAKIQALEERGGGVGADPVSARKASPFEEGQQSPATIGGTPATTLAVLYQNTPNPFTAQTEIRFSLPDDAPSSYIYIFDMTGKMQKQIPVDASQQSVTINGYELQAGIYLYSLVVGGQEIDTKRMILSK